MDLITFSLLIWLLWLVAVIAGRTMNKVTAGAVTIDNVAMAHRYPKVYASCPALLADKPFARCISAGAGRPPDQVFRTCYRKYAPTLRDCHIDLAHLH
jgi:hypothetical protein